MIQVFSPSLDTRELFQIADSFQSGWIGKGPKVEAFEAAWAKHIGVLPAQVVSTNSCTEALFMAVKMLDLGPGDEVIIPTIHFVGAAQAVIAAGAMPIFCDVDKRTLNATLSHIHARITLRTKAIILNHYGGVTCNDDIYDYLKTLDIKVIEDAACAPASIHKGKAASTFGDIGVWSFDAMKILSTGDGGMMYFEDMELAERARRLLYLGTNNATGQTSGKDKWWEFEVIEPGARRSIMNDLTAGMGLEQLQKLPDFIRRRGQIYQLYDNGLMDTPCFQPPDVPAWVEPSSYFYWIQTPKRDELAAYLRAQGVYTTFRYYPLHWAYKTGDSLPNAEQAARATLLLPIHQNLTDEQVGFICEKIKAFYG